MKVRSITCDVKTGDTVERIVDIPVMSEAECLERDRLKNIEQHNADIRAQLAANDLKAIRAILEGDSARQEAIMQQQASLRAQLK